MNQAIFEQYESEVRSYCRSFPAVFEHAKGAIITDCDGRDYIDFFCGAGTLNYGHNNDFIKKRVIDYLLEDGIMHSLDMYTKAKGEFIQYFEEEVLKPRGLNYKIQFTGPTGTNAVEAALKLARKVKKRSNIFALMGAFHGMTLGALSLTSDKKSRGGAGLPLEHITHVPAPYMFPELDTIQYMDTILSDDHSGIDHPAALVIETVQAEGGIHVFSSEWLKAARALCDKHDMLLIVDDIQVGCARTGAFFSFERAGIVPDIVTQSKSIGGIGLPFAVTLLKPEFDLWSPAEHNATFRGNQLAMVAAKAGLEYLLDEQVEAQVQKKAPLIESFLKEEIASLDQRLQVRGLGFIWGIDFGAFAENTAKQVSAACFKRGLIIELAGRKDAVLKLLPPLVIDEATLKKGLAIIKEATKEVLGK